MGNPQRRQGLAWRKLADEAVIVELKTDRLFHQLNDVGAFIWNLCDGKNSDTDIEALVAEEFEVPSETAKEDVQEFLQSLRTMNLLE